LEVLGARKREHEAEAALAAIVAQKQTGKRRWIALGVVAALAVIGVGIAVRNAQVSRKSNASLVLQLASLRSQILTQGQLSGARTKRAAKHRIRELSASLRSSGRVAGRECRFAQQISTSPGASLADLDSRLKQTDSRIGKLENESRHRTGDRRDYSNSVCLIYAI